MGQPVHRLVVRLVPNESSEVRVDVVHFVEIYLLLPEFAVLQVEQAHVDFLPLQKQLNRHNQSLRLLLISDVHYLCENMPVFNAIVLILLQLLQKYALVILLIVFLLLTRQVQVVLSLYLETHVLANLFQVSKRKFRIHVIRLVLEVTICYV